MAIGHREREYRQPPKHLDSSSARSNWINAWFNILSSCSCYPIAHFGCLPNITSSSSLRIPDYVTKRGCNMMYKVFFQSKFTDVK
ncbi:hypothetical protein GcM1_153002, partial [Golovinomyces cichoracearum]